MASAALAVAKKELSIKQIQSRLPSPLYSGPVYAQGRYRNPTSRAAQKARNDQLARIEKSLESASHGNELFVFRHVRTNQIVYSLTRTLTANDALPQLIYTGKGSIPPTIRKDLWTPLLHIQFPNPTLGLTAYRLLREFRKRHELEYDVQDIAVDPSKPFYARRRPQDPHGAKIWDYQMSRRAGDLASTRGKKSARRSGPKQERKYILMDQKANSIADVARVLELQTRELTEEEITAMMKKYRKKESKVSNKEMKRRLLRFEQWAGKEQSKIEILETTLEATRKKFEKWDKELKQLQEAIPENWHRYSTLAEMEMETGILEDRLAGREGLLNGLKKKYGDATSDRKAAKEIAHAELQVKWAREEINATKEGLEDPERTFQEAFETLEANPEDKTARRTFERFSREHWKAQQDAFPSVLESTRLKAQEWAKKVYELEDAIRAKKDNIPAARALLQERLTVRAEKKAEEAAKEGRELDPRSRELLEAAANSIAESDPSGNDKWAISRSQLLSRINSTSPIRILWEHLPDASFSPSWPPTVEHGTLGEHLHNFKDTRWDDRLKKEGYLTEETVVMTPNADKGQNKEGEKKEEDGIFSRLKLWKR